MPAFQAINVEPEESVDDQVDATRELHIDEALKRYQYALKLHAQGPRSFDEAAAAYDELFRSEIFKYPQALPEYDRAEGSPAQLSDAVHLDRALGLELVDVPDGDGDGDVDNNAASLALALYLSYKNRGLLSLDRIKDQAAKYKHDSSGDHLDEFFARPDVVRLAHSALLDFTAALDQDPSDADLWRRTSRVAAFLRSARVKRYCLEAAIELDDDPAVVDVEPPSVAEALAGEQLREQLSVLGDEVALSHPIMKPWTTKKMSALLRRHLDPIPFLPDPTESLAGPDWQREDRGPGRAPELEPGRIVIEIPVASWIEIGKAVLAYVEQEGASSSAVVFRPLEDDGRAESEETDAGEVGMTDPCNPGPFQAVLPFIKSDDDEKMAAEEHQAAELSSQDTPPPPPPPPPPQPGTGTGSAAKDDGAQPPTRKRSQSAAGLADGPEEATVETRSKRVRRRDTAQEEALDPVAVIADQLAPFHAADRHLFELTGRLLQALGVDDPALTDMVASLLDALTPEERAPEKLPTVAMADLRHAIVHYDEDAARVLLKKDSAKDQARESLVSFMDHAKSGGSQETAPIPPFNDRRGTRRFLARIEQRWMTCSDVAFAWIMALSRTYTTSRWPDELRDRAARLADLLHGDFYPLICHEIGTAEQAGNATALEQLTELVQMFFEMCVDRYAQQQSDSAATPLPSYGALAEMRGRLERWQDLAADQARMRSGPQSPYLTARLLWASVSYSAALPQPDRGHLLQCWASLRDFLVAERCGAIAMPNSSTLTTISAASAEREMSKLTTMDFFINLFRDEEVRNPLVLIDSLEPVLHPTAIQVAAEEAATNGYADSAEGAEGAGSADATPTPSSRLVRFPLKDCASRGLRNLWKFLDDSTTELRLFLWSRLGEAYGDIRYATKQFSCYLKSIEQVVADLDAGPYRSAPPESRRTALMGMLKLTDEPLIKALSLALNDSTAFDVIDDAHLRSTAATLARLSALLHVAAACEDEARVGMTTTTTTTATATAAAATTKPRLLPPASAAPASTSASAFLTKLREMQVRTWCLQYSVLKVGLAQRAVGGVAPEGSLAAYLAAVHEVLGLRKFCKASNKIFLQMTRVELLKFRQIENWESHLGQVLFDLYGLRLGAGAGAGADPAADHACTAEKMGKRGANQVIEKITILAGRVPMKDLLRSDLKTTIETIQQVIGQPKSTAQMVHNLRNMTEHLKKPISALRLHQAIGRRGVYLDTVTISHTGEAALARHGWFFLLGMLALSRFKVADLKRRQTPGATDDLRLGATFLKLQLQYTPDRWDCWFRLGECFDYELEDAVLWTADKMNKERAELVRLQRSAIHCYTLALAQARAFVSSPAMDGREQQQQQQQEQQQIESSLCADGSSGSDPLYELYHAFGCRMYASSREPFAMEPFMHIDQRVFIEASTFSTYQKVGPEHMTDYRVWRYAAGQFQLAIRRRPREWRNYYLYAKCLWKMFRKSEAELSRTDIQAKPSFGLIRNMLERAIEMLAAQPRSSRHTSEPILEPHYKMVSLMNKLVLSGGMPAQQAAQTLSRQPFGASLDEDEMIRDLGDWEEYVILSLRILRDRDKANWQHRIIMRHARILFGCQGEGEADGDGEGGRLGAIAAFNVLRESMFTKTMVMNVWKCEMERPGRHHVYTERYARLMVRLLTATGDRVNLELLLRRIRKKGADFYHFNDLWQSCCLAYLLLLRHAFRVPALAEDPFRAVYSDDFDAVADRIARRAGDAAAFRCMRDAVELKKLNANLMRAGPIDDLISDCYAALYADAGLTALSLPASPAGPPPPAEAEFAAIEIIDLTEPEIKDSHHDPAQPQQRSLPARRGQAQELELRPARAGFSTMIHPDRDGTSIAVTVSAPDAASRPRKPGIRRPEILRKAEQAVGRSLETSRPVAAAALVAGKQQSSSSSSRGAGGGSRSGSRSGSGHGKRGSNTPQNPNEEDEDVEMRDPAAAAAEDADEDAASVASNASDRQHWADDESDLSEAPPEPSDVEIDEPEPEEGEPGEGEDDGDDEDEEDDDDEPEEDSSSVLFPVGTGGVAVVERQGHHHSAVRAKEAENGDEPEEDTGGADEANNGSEDGIAG